MSTSNASMQGTVAREVRFAGRGLHTGRHSRIGVKPAPPDYGIVFQHVDSRGEQTTIKANWRNVRDLPLCTCLTDGTSRQVRTVEHLLAAFYGCGIDNAVVEVCGSEIPLLDGSAKPFVDALANAVAIQQQERKVIVISEPIEVHDGPRWIKIEPHRTLSIAIQTYVEPFGRLSWWSCDVDRATFREEIAPARTFGLLRDAVLAKMFTRFLPNPVCLGANRNNAVAIFRGRVVTPGGLRFPDEFSRHRALDLIGDLMLAGADLQAKFTCFSPIHRLTRKAIEAVFDNTTSQVPTGTSTATV
jgi:UDP-3-O-[3-hydroxymyristoyl] N-acetylglucosamine deacetylase